MGPSELLFDSVSFEKSRDTCKAKAGKRIIRQPHDSHCTEYAYTLQIR